MAADPPDICGEPGETREPVAPRPARRGTTKALGQKHDLDKFYTKRSVAAMCVAQLDLARYGRVIEPAAGDGAFVEALRAALGAPGRAPEPGRGRDESGPGHELLALDIAPEHPDIVCQDWFAFNKTSSSPTLVVGNPPFGQQCTLALRFLNHAFEVVGAQTVAFVLPRSFRKASVQQRIFRSADLALEVLLPANSFLLEGGDYDLRAVFQVWERTEHAREQVARALTSPFLDFTRKDQPHDFAIRRVGGKAGHAFLDVPETSEQSNYFVRVAPGAGRPQVAEVVDLVNSINFAVAEDGTGPKSLSKRELIALFDDAWRRRLFSERVAV